MMETLVLIPDHVAEYPLFGAGVLLAVWAVFSAALLIWLLWRQGPIGDTWSHAALLAIVGLVIWRVLPHIVKPGQGLPIRGYGVMLLAGVVAGTALSAYRGWRLGVDPDMIVTLAFWGVVPGFVGGRLFYVVEYWRDFFYTAEVQDSFSAWLAAAGPDEWLAAAGRLINITEGGLVVYGALVGGLLGFGVFIARRRLPPLAMFDVLVPGMLLGLALGRVGCLMYGCCFGGACDEPWAVRFPKGSLPYVHQAQHGVLFLQGLKLADNADAPPVIAEVEPGSPAEAAGAKPGQRVLAIDGIAVGKTRSAVRMLSDEGRLGEEIVVTIEGLDVPLRWSRVALPERSLAVHPTQVYSAIDALLLCLFLLAWDPFRRRDGELLVIVLTVYPTSRFLMEMIRTDEPGVLGTPLSIGQIVSLLTLAGAAALWFAILRRPPGKALPVPAVDS